MARRLVVDERFDGPLSDRWIPHHLPQRSSRAASRARSSTGPGGTAAHDYAVEWSPEGLAFEIDGRVVKRSAQSPRYPLQLMLDVDEFEPEPDGRYPKEFRVERVRGWADD